MPQAEMFSSCRAAAQHSIMGTEDPRTSGHWRSLVPLAALESRRRLAVEVDGTWVAALVLQDRIVAFEDLCTHEAVPLLDGDVEGTEIRCPFHGARFCLLTGAALSRPAIAPLRTFPTRTRDGWLQILT